MFHFLRIPFGVSTRETTREVISWQTASIEHTQLCTYIHIHTRERLIKFEFGNKNWICKFAHDAFDHSFARKQIIFHFQVEDGPKEWHSKCHISIKWLLQIVIPLWSSQNKFIPHWNNAIWCSCVCTRVFSPCDVRVYIDCAVTTTFECSL